MTSTAGIGRDRRIDFFRGLALLVMCVDHVEELGQRQVLSYFTYAPVGVSTAAEVFIFLSGVSLGLACLPILDRQGGYWLMHARCLARAWQLYLLHVLALVLTVAVLALLPGLMGAGPEEVPLSQSIRVSNGMLGQFALLRANPKYFDILPLYIILLVVLPPVFPILKRSVAAGLVLSGTVYAGAQVVQVFYGLSALPFGRTLYYNPLAWQLLFVIGIAVAVRLRSAGSLPVPPRSAIIAAVAVLVLVGLWYKGVRINALFGLFGDVEYVQGGGVPFDVPLTDKPTLGLVRLAHFLLLAAVVAHFSPRDAEWLRSRWAAPVIACGRNALEVFVFGIVVSYAAGVIMQALDGGRLMMVALVLAGTAGSIALAYLVRWRRSEPWRR